jgi:hypothetical protein
LLTNANVGLESGEWEREGGREQGLGNREQKNLACTGNIKFGLVRPGFPLQLAVRLSKALEIRGVGKHKLFPAAN